MITINTLQQLKNNTKLDFTIEQKKLNSDVPSTAAIPQSFKDF